MYELKQVSGEEDDAEGYLVDDDDGHAEGEDDDDESDLSGSDEEESFEGSMINDPGRATPRQRRWLTAMSEGQELHIAKRFEQCVFPTSTHAVVCHIN